jgi:hypothetical protein
MNMLVNPPPWMYLVGVQLKPDADVAGFNEWYNERHGPGILSVPGINSLDRFQSMSDDKSYLACYGIDGDHVFKEPRYAEVRGFQGWDKHVAGFQRALYRIGEGS